jgi:hypothetical protein
MKVRGFVISARNVWGVTLRRPFLQTIPPGAFASVGLRGLLKTMPAANGPFLPVAGLGDEAFLNVSDVFYVRKGDKAIQIDLRF